MTEIIFSTIALVAGFVFGRFLKNSHNEQLNQQNSGLIEQVSFYQNKAENLETELKKVTDELAKEKDIHQQVRKQLFAERDAGEDTINRLYERINGYKDDLSKLTEENKNLRYRSVPE